MPLDWECPKCDTVYHTDTKLAIEGFSEWNYCPNCGYRRDEQSAEEVAKEHGEIVEFGWAVRGFERAATELRQNGHATVGALEIAEDAQEWLGIVFNEYDQIREHRKKEESQ